MATLDLCGTRDPIRTSRGGMEPWREWKEWEVSTFLVVGRLGELLFYHFVSSWTPCYAYAVLLQCKRVSSQEL